MRRPLDPTAAALLVVPLLLLPPSGPALGQEDGEPRSSESDETDAEAPTAPGVKEFDTVDVDRVSPGDLPSSAESKLPDVVRSTDSPGDPPSRDELRATADRVDDRLFTVVAVDETEAPGDATPVVQRGHALFVQHPDGGPPILVSSLFWLSDASEIYIHPDPRSAAGADDQTPSPERRTLEESTAGGTEAAWLKKHRDQLVEAKLYRPDRHRNLVAVVPDDTSAVNLPKSGLQFFDLDESPGRLYGFSPKTGTQLSETTILPGRPDQRALKFYLQTTYAAAYGAPIVSGDGQLLGMTAFRHPGDSGIVLVVPPEAIRKFVGGVVETVDDTG